MDLNTDCQILVLENLQMDNLYSLSKTNKYFSNFVDDILRQKYLKKMVIFRSLFAYSTSPTFDFDETDKGVEVRYAKTAIKMLKKFGHSIRNLKIQNIVRNEFHAQIDIKEVYNLIEEHCSETLSELHLEWMKENFFANITIPFKNVKSVSLLGEIGGLGNDQLNFQQMFPSLRRLRLNDVRNQNITTLETEFPHLDHLHVYIQKYDQYGYLAESVTMGLIRNNPHIRSIVLINSGANMLHFVSNELLNLEKLTISNYKQTSPHTFQFHFEHVKSFKIDNCHDQNMPSNITFGDKLEEFELEACKDKHIDFIIRNRNLKKIHIDASFGLENNDIQLLASANLNVVDMYITSEWGVEGKNLIDLVENCKQLKQLHVKLFMSHTIFMDNLVWGVRSHLQNDWTLNVDKREIFIVRKNHVN